MSTVNEITIEVPRHVVWSVLSEPACFAKWVIGTKQIRGADPLWPRVGSKFDHTVGAGPIATDDTTTSVDEVAQSHLVLEVRFRPLGVGVVELDLENQERGATRLVMRERFIEGPVMRLPRQMRDALSGARNWLSLRRLRSLCEQRSPLAGG